MHRHQNKHNTPLVRMSVRLSVRPSVRPSVRNLSGRLLPKYWPDFNGTWHASSLGGVVVHLGSRLTLTYFSRSQRVILLFTHILSFTFQVWDPVLQFCAWVCILRPYITYIPGFVEKQLKNFLWFFLLFFGFDYVSVCQEFVRTTPPKLLNRFQRDFACIIIGWGSCAPGVTFDLDLLFKVTGCHSSITFQIWDLVPQFFAC